VSKELKACAPAHSFCSVPRKLTICPRRWTNASGVGLHLAGHAVEALVQQGAQRPAGAVAGEHVEVVDVEVGLAVRLADFRRVDVGQPVVGDDLAETLRISPPSE
jgi:hypothetical protein